MSIDHRIRNGNTLFNGNAFETPDEGVRVMPGNVPRSSICSPIPLIQIREMLFDNREKIFVNCRIQTKW